MFTLKNIFLAAIMVIVTACGGNNNNRTGGAGMGMGMGPMGGMLGSLDGTDVGTKIHVLLDSNRCRHPNYQGPHQPMSLVFQKLGGAANQGFGFQGATLDIQVTGFNVKDISVGKTFYNDVVVIQDFGMTMNVLVFLCSPAAPIANAQISALSTSVVNNCNINQISQIEMLLFSSLGQYPIAAYPIYFDGAAPGICY